MNPDYAALYNYIDAHRRNGTPDATIYRDLISSGWPDEIIHQALTAMPAPLDPMAPAMPASQHQQYAAQPVQDDSNRGFFKGRLDRRGYLAAMGYVLTPPLLSVVLALLNISTMLTMFVFIVIGVELIVVIPTSVALHIRRWHDLGQSGWMTLLALVPFIGLLISIALFFMPGTKGPNAFGASPQPSLSFKDVFGLK